MTYNDLSYDRLASLTFPKAIEYSELVLLKCSLDTCASAVSIIKKYLTDDTIALREDISDEGKVLVECLTRDVVTQFVGCFGRIDEKTSASYLSPRSVLGSIENGIEFFQKLSDIRNSYAAHRHGSLRQTHAVMRLHTQSAIAEVECISGLPLTVGFLYSDLASIISITTRWLDVQIASAKSEVEDQVREMSLDELLALPPVLMKIPTPDEYTMTREQYAGRRKKRG